MRSFPLWSAAILAVSLVAPSSAEEGPKFEALGVDLHSGVDPCLLDPSTDPHWLETAVTHFAEAHGGSKNVALHLSLQPPVPYAPRSFGMPGYDLSKPPLPSLDKIRAWQGSEMAKRFEAYAAAGSKTGAGPDEKEIGDIARQALGDKDLAPSFEAWRKVRLVINRAVAKALKDRGATITAVDGPELFGDAPPPFLPPEVATAKGSSEANDRAIDRILATYTKNVAESAGTLAPYVAAHEILWRPNAGGNPERFAQFLEAGGEAVKKAAPGTTVIAGELAVDPGHPDAAVTFFQKTLAALGGNAPFDAYGFGAAAPSPTAMSAPGAVTVSADGFNDVARKLAAAAPAGKPLRVFVPADQLAKLGLEPEPAPASTGGILGSLR